MFSSFWFTCAVPFLFFGGLFALTLHLTLRLSKINEDIGWNLPLLLWFFGAMTTLFPLRYVTSYLYDMSFYIKIISTNLNIYLWGLYFIGLLVLTICLARKHVKEKGRYRFGIPALSLLLLFCVFGGLAFMSSVAWLTYGLLPLLFFGGFFALTLQLASRLSKKNVRTGCILPLLLCFFGTLTTLFTLFAMILCFEKTFVSDILGRLCYIGLLVVIALCLKETFVICNLLALCFIGFLVLIIRLMQKRKKEKGKFGFWLSALSIFLIVCIVLLTCSAIDVGYRTLKSVFSDRTHTATESSESTNKESRVIRGESPLTLTPTSSR